MNITEAIHRLERLVNMNCGASRAGASVLLYAWDPDHPIRDLYTLDRENFRAALIVIEGTFGNCLRENIPQICSTLDLPKLAERYGKNGWHWQPENT